MPNWATDHGVAVLTHDWDFAAIPRVVNELVVKEI